MHRICVLLSVGRMGASPSLHHPMLVAEQRSTAAGEGKGQQAAHTGLSCATLGAGGEHGGVVYAGFARHVSLVGMAPLGFFLSNKPPSPSASTKSYVHSYQLSQATLTIQGINESAKNRRILPQGPCKQRAPSL